MTPPIVLFEDHTAEDFRPLSWSQPVYEIRCGIFNLRERIALLAPRDTVRGLLPRGLLLPLQRLTLPPGAVAGPDACRGAIEAGGGALFLNARLGPSWPLLAGLCADLGDGAGWTWFDGDSLLACRVGAESGVALLDAWRAWDDETAAAAAWTLGEAHARPFRPLDPLASLPARPAPEPGAGEGAADQTPALRRLWDVVPVLGRALADDTARAIAGRAAFARVPFGIVPDPAAWQGDPPWSAPGGFEPWGDARRDGASGVHAWGEVWVADGVVLDPGVVIDAAHGPVVLDRRVHVQPFCYLQGPLYVGPGSLVKSGARIYGETSIGGVCRVAGEVGESQFHDFGNKQHDGFIGHAVLGSWVNLGAGTTCSDLKNNYGAVRVDYGLGPIDSGLRFLGLMMGDHAKSAIGTLFNTGTTVGFGANVFGAGLPPKRLPNYCWGDPQGPPYAPERAIEVARTVMGRRGCRFTDEHARLFRALGR